MQVYYYNSLTALSQNEARFYKNYLDLIEQDLDRNPVILENLVMYHSSIIDGIFSDFMTVTSNFVG